MNRWCARPDLTAAQQYQFLLRNPVCAGSGALRPGSLRWTYRMRPSILAREYTVEISFKQGGIPRVFIRDPDLECLAGGRDIPHIYKNPTNLCLYLPGSNEWVGSMRIDLTFVPWVATWLYYFEEWLESDDWKGGGEHPAAGESADSNRRARRAVRLLGTVTPAR